MADREEVWGVGRMLLHWGSAFLRILGPNGGSPIHFKIKKKKANKTFPMIL